MKNKIKNLLLLASAGCVLVLIPVFFAQDKPIEVTLATLTEKEFAAQQETQQKAAQATAQKAKVRRVFRCQADEDCIIVDKDPCGCLIGPEGVTAINASFTLDFDEMQSKAVSKACPNRAPSREKECSPSAVPVCRENICHIAY